VIRSSKREVERRASVPAKLELLLAAQRWPPPQRAAWVRERLTSLLTAARRTPYGRRQLPAGAGLADAPLLDRATLRERFQDLLEPGLETPVFERSTSGSTGRPVRVVHGPETVGYAEAARLRQLTWFGLEPRLHPQVNTRIAADADDPPVWREPGREPALFWVNPYALDPSTIEPVHDQLLAAGGVTLAGAESSLLARWAALYSGSMREGAELGVKLAIVGGEMTYPDQREAVRNAFGCPVAEMYGSHELSIIATECPDGSLHVAEEAVLLELLDADGDPVEDGERGEVVVTLLHNSEMPLLRYRLGDVAAMVPGPCACGCTLARLDVEIGRLEENVRAPDGALVHPRFLRSIYERCVGPGLRAFHTTQEAPDLFRIELELSDEPEPGLERRLEREIARYLGAPVTVHLELGPLPSPAGKLRTFTRSL
jgi:phenylacetate-coenzyme A ligase PaaK-like adenylate-forming protein